MLKNNSTPLKNHHIDDIGSKDYLKTDNLQNTFKKEYKISLMLSFNILIKILIPDFFKNIIIKIFGL